jgi:catechol 2,3-dioxygenase-like lactoylglutathione lyase family enzyme
MPKGIFHAVVLTDDLEGTLRFLHDVSGIKPVRRYQPEPEQLAAAFGWPTHIRAPAAMVGEGPGMMEVIEIPAGLRGEVAPGVSLLAVATTDVDGRVEAARAAGFQPDAVRTAIGADGTSITVAPVRVGGVGYEFVRFG